VRHQATATFWKPYQKLKPEIQTLADKNFALLKKDPKHPSLRFKCIRDDLWSARIGLHFRALAIEGKDGFSWVWIGSHDEYDRIIG
jgi:hypothetical protein